MRTVLEALTSLSDSFKEHKIEQGRRQVEELLCDVLNCNRLQLYLNYEQPLSDIEWQKCLDNSSRRLRGEPLAYIHGSVEFYHCTFQVTPDVLIPRPETEILVDKIVQILSKEDLEGKVLLDLCCGSGIIGISLKKQFPKLKVILSDLSSAALKIAQKNAELNNVHVSFLEGDLLQPLKNQKIDYFVCNPPYISETEYRQLDREVRDFEPKQSLIGGSTGLEFYERLTKTLHSHMNPNGKVWLEIGYQQGNAVKSLFNTPSWQNQQVENDWAGYNRFFYCETN